MSDIELIAVIERYLNGEMNTDERIRFEMLRRDNAGVDQTVIEHQEFTSRLKQYGERLQFEAMLNDIHNEIDVQALKDEFIHHPSTLVRFWRNHHSKISVAASIAIFAVLATLFFTGYLKTQKQETDVINLKHEIDVVKNDNRHLHTSLSHLVGNGQKAAPDNFKGTGTGFAVSTQGYIVTNFHVVNGADSIYVQNADGNAYHAKIISYDPAYDIAILKINDPSFKTLSALPYGFKKAKTELGEDVFTIGYSKDDAVYNQGYVSSGNGVKGDSVRYQLSSMEVNFGNSGGPLLDAKGNVIGVISSKQAGVEGAAFAIKSKYLFKAIQSIPPDSLRSVINLSAKNSIASLGRTQQIKKLSNYIFMVKVYNN